MPAWEGRLDPVTIKELAVYVHSLGGGEWHASVSCIAHLGDRLRSDATLPVPPLRGEGTLVQPAIVRSDTMRDIDARALVSPSPLRGGLGRGSMAAGPLRATWQGLLSHGRRPHGTPRSRRSTSRPSAADARRSMRSARIHPKRAQRPFRRLKWVVMAVTLAIYYLTPWIRWDRGPARPTRRC